MASNIIRRTWFSRAAPGNMVMTVPTSGVGPPQKSEAAFISQLEMNYLKAGTKTTQAAGAVTVGNVVSSTPAGGTGLAAGSAVAYLVSI